MGQSACKCFESYWQSNGKVVKGCQSPLRVLATFVNGTKLSDSFLNTSDNLPEGNSYPLEQMTESI
jgi:hypothetical protein